MDEIFKRDWALAEKVVRRRIDKLPLFIRMLIIGGNGVDYEIRQEIYGFPRDLGEWRFHTLKNKQPASAEPSSQIHD